jgi:DNA-binding response OmpR family regulator
VNNPKYVPGSNLPTSILIADDDIAIRKFISTNLIKSNYQVMLAADGPQALDIYKVKPLNLIILDLSLPQLNGFEICRLIRQQSAVPIIMLSDTDEVDKKVQCFEMGSDDFVIKPFSIEELLGRIRAILRRVRLTSPVSSTFRCGDLVINFDNRSAYIDKQEIELTATEFAILYYLALNAGKPVSSDYLLQNIWGPEYVLNNRVLWVNISRLRSKIEDGSGAASYIKSRFGQGYLLRKGDFNFQ